MDVLKICVAQGVLACNLWLPILDEEMNDRSADMDGRGTKRC